MGSLRVGLATYWTAILELVDTEDLTNDSLYRRGINRLSDRTAWLLGDNVRRTATLARSTLGTTGKTTGSVDLGTRVYDDVAGDLNGLTLQVQSDTSAVITVTFGSGTGAAPTGPADVVTAINTASAGNPFASVDSAGHLSVESVTSGGTGVITVVGGSALSLLGFSAGQTATGASTGGDGLSQVAGAAIGTAGTGVGVVAAGTLRSMLATIAASSTAFTTFTALVAALANSTAVAGAGSSLIGQRSISDAFQGNLSSGSVLTALQVIWAGKAGLAGQNIFTALQTYNAGVIHNAGRTRNGASATDAERVLNRASNAGSFSFASAYDSIFVDMNDGLVGTSHIWTATATGAVLNTTVNLAVFTPTLAHTVTVKRDDGSAIFTVGNGGLGGFGTVKFLADAANPAGRWHLMSASGDVTINTPY